VEEAINRINARGGKVAASSRGCSSFPKHQLRVHRRSARLLIVELSYSAQFYKYLRTFMDLPEDRTSVYKRSGRKDLTVAEIESEITRLGERVTAREEVLS